MIVADTTVWIDFLEARATPQDLHLTRLIEEGAPVGLTDMIYCEVLQGIGPDATFRRTRELLRAFPILCVSGLETFEEASAIYRACRKKGLTIRSTVDCLIAAVCLEAGAELFHNDRDFDAIAKVRGLRLHRMLPKEVV
ncbi:MAG: PIN domain nuclease [Nitrospirota bacterium]